MGANCCSKPASLKSNKMDERQISDPEDLYQIALLIDQLKHDDLQLRINATKNLPKIAHALGPERTRCELVPFLTESADDDDDVLIIMAEKLGELCSALGGNEHVHIMLAPLERLASGEESTVRDATIAAVEIVVARMPDEHISQFYVPFVMRLACKEWYTSRISAASMFHCAFARIEVQKNEFRALYLKLCADGTAAVRRAAARHFGSMLQAQRGGADLLSLFLPAFALLAQDEQDSVRIQVVEICVSFAKQLPDSRTAQVLPIVMKLAEDRAWRVRWSVANQMPRLCESFPGNAATSSVFESLLSDSEAEVRAAAASRITLVSAQMPKSVVVAHVLPATQRLVTDVSEHVRAALAAVINGLAVILGKEDTVTHLLPMLLLFLRDEASEVRLSIISNLDAINKVIGVDLLSQSLLPAIVDLAEDSKWRVRLAVIEHIPKLAEQLGGDFFNEKLNGLCMTWLGDEVYSIRRAATDNLKKLSVLFGEEWTREQILPQVERMLVHTNYLHRVTALYGLQVLLPCVSRETLESSILPMMLSVSGDAVANVRFTIARSLLLLSPAARGSLSRQCLADVAEVLSKLQQDQDRDVRFYSSQAALTLQLQHS